MYVLRALFFAVYWPLLGLWRLARWLRPHIFDRKKNSRSSGSGTHGTARFATRLELLKGGVLTGKGPVLGKGPWGRLIRFTTDGLVMVFAATGSGKGLGVVVPTLLDYPGSILVTDPKCENYDITKRHRATLGRVLMLNPTNISESNRFNPLDMIRAGTPLEADDAKALALLMITPDPNSAAHWAEKASSLLTALILHTLQEPPVTRTLAHVRTLSVGGPEAIRDTLQEIADTSPSAKASEIAAGFLGTIPKGASGKAGEFESILSTLHSATEPWSRGSPAGILSGYSDFALSDLVDEVCTLYLCVEEELLVVYSAWLRVMTGCAINAMMRAKRLPECGYKVMLLLDEVVVLGPLEPLQRQSGLLRAYCTPVLIWQNMPQAESVYGNKAEAFLANASARVFFGLNDNNTAAYVANMLGHTTTLSASQGVSQSSESWLRQNRQQGQSESGYWLLDPSEVQRLPPDSVVIKFRDLPFPVSCGRLDYRKIWRWRGLWDRWRATSRAPARGRDDGPPSAGGMTHGPRSSTSQPTPADGLAPLHVLPVPPETPSQARL